VTIPYPSPPEWDWFWSHEVGPDRRRAFWQGVRNDDVAVVNEGFRALAEELLDRVGDDDEREAFERALDEHGPATEVPDVGEVVAMREDPDAGVVWLDFPFLRADSPPHVVGHTARDEVVRRGNVVCQDTVLRDVDSPGGESVVVETSDGLRALTRRQDGSVALADL
jgi:hypothetical protein